MLAELTILKVLGLSVATGETTPPRPSPATCNFWDGPGDFRVVGPRIQIDTSKIRQAAIGAGLDRV